MREQWIELAESIKEAFENKTPDAGHYGKRDWAMLAVLEALRKVALRQAERAAVIRYAVPEDVFTKEALQHYQAHNHGPTGTLVHRCPLCDAVREFWRPRKPDGT